MDMARWSWERINRENDFLLIGCDRLRAILYPLSVVKTRQQAAAGFDRENPFRVTKAILKNEGFRGLYRGLATVSISVYDSVLEVY